MSDEVERGEDTPPTVRVAGLSEYSGTLFETLPRAGEQAVAPLLYAEELRGPLGRSGERLVAAARQRVREADDRTDALISLLDFPAVEVVALLGRELGLRTPTLEAVLACTHKFWSRQLQREAAPECVPACQWFDPWRVGAITGMGMALPVWIKPLNAYRSHLGFGVHNTEEFDQGVDLLRKGDLDKLAGPLEYFMAQADVPDEIRQAGGHIAIAEQFIEGEQVTLEGYVLDGVTTIYAAIDSIREPNGSTFARYQYPSGLPAGVLWRMGEWTKAIVAHIGFDNSTFNAEFFWDRRTDRIALVEINPRLSQSHCELLAKVDGASHQQVAIDVALGRTPSIPHREGPYAVAAKCFLRSFRDGTVTRAPSAEDVARVSEAVPGTTVEVLAPEGQLLRDMPDQDAYSYELAVVWLGADNARDLIGRWRTIRASLPYEIDGVALDVPADE